LKLSRNCKKDISIGLTFGHFTAIVNFCLFNKQFPRLEAFLLFHLAAGATFSYALATQGSMGQKLAAVRLLIYCPHISVDIYCPKLVSNLIGVDILKAIVPERFW
tara:strand:+ start:809 stop:1123 length:315 start_codon:yes stop_codon:yes gene_type:complete